MWFGFAPKYIDLLNTGGTDSVTKLQEETGRCKDVALDRAATPGTAVYGNREGSRALKVEPASRNRVELGSDNTNGIG
jgi:hypothetical protein